MNSYDNASHAFPPGHAVAGERKDREDKETLAD